ALADPCPSRQRLAGVGAALDRLGWHTVDETTGELLKMMRAFELPAFIVGLVIVLPLRRLIGHRSFIWVLFAIRPMAVAVRFGHPASVCVGRIVRPTFCDARIASVYVVVVAWGQDRHAAMPEPWASPQLRSVISRYGCSWACKGRGAAPQQKT
ncbi:MAG: hypothetical protein AAFR70_01000, partial [Pseudomonadota bacterium]